MKTGGDNGRNPDVAQDQPFAWEYVHMDDLLVDLKLPPETLEIPIPSYFVEQREEQHNRRDRLIEGCVVVVVAVVFMAICFCVFVLVSCATLFFFFSFFFLKYRRIGSRNVEKKMYCPSTNI